MYEKYVLFGFCADFKEITLGKKLFSFVISFLYLGLMFELLKMICKSVLFFVYTVEARMRAKVDADGR